MKNISKVLIWFIASFIVFHLILFVMWGEHQEYWYLYTGIMLIAGISYVFYQRDIESKRLFNFYRSWYRYRYRLGYNTINFSLLSHHK